MIWNLQELKKSDTDENIAGVCGGLGQYTPVPAWLWRALFVATFFLGGFGFITYVILWICMPASTSSR